MIPGWRCHKAEDESEMRNIWSFLLSFLIFLSLKTFLLLDCMTDLSKSILSLSLSLSLDIGRLVGSCDTVYQDIDVIYIRTRSLLGLYIVFLRSYREIVLHTVFRLLMDLSKSFLLLSLDGLRIAYTRM
jgi:hypothetical protein